MGQTKIGESKRYYAIVEEKIEALDGNIHRRSRSTLLLDGIDADRFESDNREIDNPSALGLVRTMTTEHVWEARHQLANIAKGDWVEFQLDDKGSAPMAWEMPANEDYRRGPKRSLRMIRRLGRAIGDVPDDETDRALVMRLNAASNAGRSQHQTVPLQTLANRIGTNFVQPITIVILDVGQASAALISQGNGPLALFDAGAPLWFNKGSIALGFQPPALGNGFIFLSHWDFDHFDMGRRQIAWHNHDWYAPDQMVSPNTALFQKKLGRHLTFVSGSLQHRGFIFERGTATDPLDRNGSGYQLRYENGSDAVLLTGDADYDAIQPAMKAKLTHLCIPHHGARGTTPPKPVGGQGHAAVSYGLPNGYRHPHDPQIIAHTTLGWKVQPTAVGIQQRGNRQLYP
jgi:beta-lactamase superfamily II metal-dependent hydrolase